MPDMPRLDDANVADEYGPDRFMPREVDELSAQQAVADTPDWAHVTISVREGEREWLIATRRPGGWVSGGRYFPDRDVIEVHARHVFRDDELRQHDAEVAAKAVEDARAEMRRMMDGFPQKGRHTRASWALNWLDVIAARIRREAGTTAQPTGRVITTPGGGELTEHDDGTLHITKPDQRSWTPGGEQS